MPKSTVCKVKIGGKWKRIKIDDALAMDKLRWLCINIKCGKPVRPHRRSKNGKQAAHFEHLNRNPKCPLSDHR